MTLKRSLSPRTAISKEHRGHLIVFSFPGTGRMFPHSGQKLKSPLKHDIAEKNNYRDLFYTLHPQRSKQLGLL